MPNERIIMTDMAAQELKKTARTESAATDIVIADKGFLRDKIYEIRGMKGMSDFELAEIYGYETKNFNRQVKNNAAPT